MPATTTKGYPYPVGTDRVMDGDDSIKNLATEVDTHLGRVASGSVMVSLPTAGVAGSIAVTFPVGRFTVAPQIATALASGNAGYMGGTATGVTGITTSGCVISAVRSGSNTSMGVSWVANQS